MYRFQEELEMVPRVPDGFEEMFRVPACPENSNTLQSGQRCLT
jgi:hypothetical protein